MITSGRARAWILAGLWGLLVVTLFAGVTTSDFALAWNIVMIATSVLTGLWASDWVRSRRSR
jgi:general stress protein CsbA